MPNVKAIVYLLLLVIIALTCICCEEHTVPATLYPDHTFSSSEWKKDSAGCLTYRENKYEGIAKNEVYFVGKNYNFLVEFLGKPSAISKKNGNINRLYYAVDCTAIPPLKAESSSKSRVSNKIKYSLDYATTLIFYMRKDTCTSMVISMP